VTYPTCNYAIIKLMFMKGSIMLRAIFISSALSLVASNMAVAQGCVKPTKPMIPNGASASMEEMVEAQTAVKAYQTGMADFRKCHEANMEAMKPGFAEAEGTATASYIGSNRAFNDSVSQEEQVAAEFNTAIKAYKAANPSE
jgi:hypothetical protein